MGKAKSRIVIFALIKETKILIEKRPIEGFLKHQILIPGGAVNELTFENLEEALKREMMEELGIKPLEFELLTEDEIHGLNNTLLKPFVVKSWEGNIPATGLDKEDAYPLFWMEIDELLQVSIKPTRQIVKALQKYLNR